MRASSEQTATKGNNLHIDPKFKAQPFGLGLGDNAAMPIGFHESRHSIDRLMLTGPHHPPRMRHTTEAKKPDRTASTPEGSAVAPSSRIGPLKLDPEGKGKAAKTPDRAQPPKPVPVQFDLCHVGVVLRAVVFVHAVLAVGLMFSNPSLNAWIAAFSVATGLALPGVLLWLSLACLFKGWFSRWSAALRWLLACVLGAFAGGVSWVLGEWMGLGDIAGRPWMAPVCTGAAMAWGITLWLQWREQARIPAEATARLAELQSRIRPHFLFNTLNTALALVRLDPTRAEAVLEDLSELFRVALGETGQAVTLAEEIDLARRYLAIEQIRFGERLKISWELDPAANAARLPSLLLQPLVENAVHHGVEPSSDGGQVRIRTRVSAGRVHVSIFNTVPSAPSQHGHQIALRNVKERLHLMHDVASRFETRLHEGVFSVQMTLPL